MSWPVRWSTNALADLVDQIASIAADNPAAARRVADARDKTALALGDMPRGRHGRVTGTYEKSVMACPTFSSTRSRRQAAKKKSRLFE